MRTAALFVVGTALGIAVIAGGIFYFAWVASLTEPVDWLSVTQAALLIGPSFGWAGGSILVLRDEERSR